MLIFFVLSALFACDFAHRSSSSSRYPLLLISFDGLQALKFNEYLSKFPDSNFNRLIREGVRARQMKPIFPTKTWPNHVTLVTGLFAESHGIVGNALYDPASDEAVNFVFGSNAQDPKFWNTTAEPLWMTAKKQGLRTASLNWIGSDVIGRTPGK